MRNYAAVWVRSATVIIAINGTLAVQSSSGAQVAPIAQQSVDGLIVHGHGEIKAKPDVAYATLSVLTQDKLQTAAVSENASKSQDMLTALKSSGVAANDIQTDSYTVQPQYDYTISPAVLTNYEVVNSFRVTLRTISKAGLILDKAIQAGATETEGVSFDISDRHKVNGEALVAAVADARMKADLMAGAAGVSLGRLKSLSDDAQQTPVFQPRMMAMAKAVESTITPIAPQTIVIDADVTAVYAISSVK